MIDTDARSPEDQAFRAWLQSQIRWYQERVDKHRLASISIRGFAVAALLAAGIIAGTDHTLDTANLLVVFGVASGLLMADLVFGFSKTWARYSLALMQLKGLEQAYLSPTHAERIQAVVTIIVEETKGWSDDLAQSQSFLLKMFEPFHSRTTTPLRNAFVHTTTSRCALTVEVPGFDPTFRWRLVLNDWAVKECTGRAGGALVPGSGPAILKVVDEQGEILFERAIVLEPNKVHSESFTHSDPT